MDRGILCLNAGSSSIKLRLYRRDGAREPTRLAGGRIAGIGTAPHLTMTGADGEVLLERAWPDDSGKALTHEALLGEALDWVKAHLGDTRLGAIGHRVVHGGAEFAAPVVVDARVMAALEDLCPLAPLHQPHGLAAIRAASGLAPGVPQIACFDTAFHRTLPPVATRLALPDDCVAAGVRRYGFHGISYEYIARRLAALDPALARGRVIVAHLGNGASLCALRDGASIDTTMGFTALDGLVMGTRCGTTDPGAVLFLIRQLGLDAAALEHRLYEDSGLLAVSGVSSDMHVLLESAEPRAREAVELFVYRLVREAGGMVAALGGLDGLVFTAGIGENAPEIRAQVCERLGWLGIVCDAAANARGDAVISTPESRVTVRVIPTDEEGMIALHVARMLAHDS